MKSLFIILFTFLSTSVLGGTYFQKSIEAIKLDAESILDGESNVTPNDYVPLSNTANDLLPRVQNGQLTDRQAFAILIDTCLNQAGLEVTMFVQVIYQYQEDLNLLLQYYTMTSNKLEFELNDWNVPARIPDRITSIEVELRNKPYILQEERQRLLKTPNSMVYEVTADGQRYLILNTVDYLLEIVTASPGGENLRCQSGFCPPNRPGHIAIDVSQGLHMKVFSILPGIVTNYNDPDGLGKFTTVYSPHLDVTMVYAHFGSWLIPNGTYIEAGTAIGREGYTGSVKPSCKTCLGNHTHIMMIKGEWKWSKSNVLNLETCMPSFKKRAYFDGKILEKIYLKETNGKHGPWEVITEEEFLEEIKEQSQVELSMN